MSSIFKNIVSLIALLLFTSITFAQDDQPNVQIKVYGFEEGLTHRNIFKIQQDPQGYLWIATINGLNRFDGNKFLNFTSSSRENSIPNDFIYDMVVTPDSALWLASQNLLVHFNPTSTKVTKIKAVDNQNNSGLPKTFNNLYIDQKGKLWTSTHTNETGQSTIQHINADTLLTDILTCEGNYAKRAIVQNGNSYFVAYDHNTLWETDATGKRLYTYTISKNNPAWVTKMLVDQEGKLWTLLSNGKLYSLAPGQKEFVSHPLNQLITKTGVYTALTIQNNGDIWIGGTDALWNYESLSRKANNFSPTLKSLLKHTPNYRDIFIDQTGVIWVASDLGLIKITKTNPLFVTYLDEVNEYCNGTPCSMRGITGDDKGNVYFTYYNSIHVLPKNANAPQPLSPQNNLFNSPFGITYHKDALWTGNGKRIDLATLRVDTILPTSQPAEGHVMVDNDGHIWWGAGKSFSYYDPTSGISRNLIDPKGVIDYEKLTINYVYQGKTGNYVWVGTANDGLYKLHKTRGALRHYTTEGSDAPVLLHNKINGIHEDNKGNLWFATGDGLHQLAIATDQLRVYNSKHGLPNSFINGLLSEGDSVLWVSTDNGLSRFSINRLQFINFNKQDGLSANEFNRVSFYKAPDGRMFFGGMEGVNSFYPGDKFLIQQAQKEGKLLFTSFTKLDGKYDSLISQHIGLDNLRPINLSYKDKFFTFEFSLANFENPSEHVYSFKLDGYESDWSEASPVNKARYNIIPHGNYTFRVRARSGNGNWSAEELAIPVTIQQPYYTTWWFISLCVLALGWVIYAVSWYRLYAARQQEIILKKEVHNRTIELQKAMKKSDELLLNILPEETAEELKKFGKAQAKRHESVTVFFSDFKGFTLISQQLEPEELVQEIDYCFRYFDEVMGKYNLEKIKTIGDAYMCAGGITSQEKINAVNIVKAALDIQNFLIQLAQKRTSQNKHCFEARIGIHTGPVVSGIVGSKKFAYDIWGDTVNVAARLEDNSEVGKVNISQTTYELVKDHFNCTYRGKITVKHKGDIDMYYVEGRKNGVPVS